MPRRTDISHILVIGSGPIVIGQACEFDYSGTQACRVLRAEGFRVSLVNSNPATIMTDPEFADATYVEPLTTEFVEKVIAVERPDAILATLGGQTALNLAVSLAEEGVLEKYGVELIGADIEAIERGEDRQKFKEIVAKAGGRTPASLVCKTLDEAIEFAATVGNRIVVRPSFTMGGLGSGLANDADEVRTMVARGLAASPVHEVLVEQSVRGWKEFELELMRDRNDNVVVVCSIENIDPMGVHTGDSITVAPSMTLTDREYQHMRDIGIAVLREVGVDTGGCNIQFAIDPATGDMIVIEMNPRVSRSSALASKATGFPIAKIAAKLAVGYTLDEIPNDITRKTPAAFEPALDYVVVKVPRFAFEKFPGADPVLTTHMKSVGEAMSIGRNFTEALGKALRSMETKVAGFWTGPAEQPLPLEEVLSLAGVPTDGRLYLVERALRAGATVDEVHRATGIDPWFLDQILLIVEVGTELRDAPTLTDALLRKGKRHGLSDRQIAALRPELAGEDGVRSLRHRLGIRPVYKTVDTCAAEFDAATPYYYSSYDEETEVAPQPDRQKVIILGSGPNRIGQGIEFDYSCVHAVMALRDAGYETVMVNCNPETVSTDYDTADRLYFEPLTFEDVLEVVHAEQQSGQVAGVICTLGGQTPLGLAQRLKDAGVPVLGTQPEAIDLAEHRGAFGRVLAAADLPAPKHGRPRASSRPRRWPTPSGTRCSCAPPTCSAAAGWRSSTTRRTWPTTSAGPPRSRPTTRCSSTASSTTRSRSTSTPSTTAPTCTSAASWSTSRRPASTPATRRARCRPSRSVRPRSPASAPRRSPSRRAWGCADCSTSSTRSPATCCTCSRPTPARPAPSRSSPRPPRCSSPRPPPASPSARRSPTCGPRA